MGQKYIKKIENKIESKSRKLINYNENEERNIINNKKKRKKYDKRKKRIQVPRSLGG